MFDGLIKYVLNRVGKDNANALGPSVSGITEVLYMVVKDNALGPSVSGKHDIQWHILE